METAIKERPILFSGPMVRAILAGQKTQTRRIVKPQPEAWKHDTEGWELCRSPNHRPLFPESFTKSYCPYGVSGERLWVRESWRWTVDKKANVAIEYQADGEIRRALCENDGEGELVATEKYENQLLRLPSTLNWKPSIHMPRAASRINLQIVRVGVERVRGISREDAIAEGIFLNDNDWWDTGTGLRGQLSPEAAFRELWASINGSESWTNNPWVWVVEFKKVNP
jgi:hypothetical protein